MAWVIIPGYGIWPSRSIRPLNRTRIIGQANPTFLGQTKGRPSFTVEDDRPAIRFPNMSPEGLEAHRKFAEAFGVDPSQRHGFDALLELVEEDERAFKSPTPKQAQDQAEKMAETVRELARKGIASSVDWLSFTSPEIRNGFPTVVIGVRPSVVVGKGPTGVPLVNVRGKPLPVTPSKIHGRPVEFRLSEVVPYGATEVEPLGDDGVPPRLLAAKRTLKRRLGAGGSLPWPKWLVGFGVTGVGPGHDWNALQVSVLEGPENDEAAASVPRFVDGFPVVVERQGFPTMLGDVDDSTVMSNNWTGTRGGWYDFSGPEVAPGGAEDMGSTLRLNTDVGGMTLKPLLIKSLRANGGVYVRAADNSWSFVLDPSLRVKLMLRGVRAPTAVPADKFVCWNTVPTQPLVGGFTHPETGFHCRSRDIPLEWDAVLTGDPRLRLTGADPLDGMADTSVPPTPLARAEDLGRKINEAIGALGGRAPAWWLYTLPLTQGDRPLVKLGVKGDLQPDAKELKALPWAQWVSLGVEINVEFVPPTGSGIKGTVAKITPEGFIQAGMADMGSAPVDTVWPTSSPDWREPTGPATSDDDPAMGSHGFPARWRMPSKYAQPPLLPEDSGMGAAPVVAMPTGMLNWDRVSGYEGQPWVVKDWSNQNFMGGQLEFDDTFMGDMADNGAVYMGDTTSGAPVSQHGSRTVAFGAMTAILGAAAGWALAPGGDPRRAAIIGGIGGGLAGMLVGKLIGGAEGTIEAVATASKAPEPVQT